MTKILYIFIFILTLAQLSLCVPEIVGLNTELAKKTLGSKSSQESEKEAQKEKEKEESSLSRINELSEKVITQFYYLSSNIEDELICLNFFLLGNSSAKNNNLYIEYSNLRI